MAPSTQTSKIGHNFFYAKSHSSKTIIARFAKLGTNNLKISYYKVAILKKSKMGAMVLNQSGRDDAQFSKFRLSHSSLS